MIAHAFNAILLFACLFAARCGGAPEKIAAALLLSADVASVFSGANASGYRSVEWGVFAVDCVLLAAMFALALHANRYWPLWITSLQFVTIWSHLAFATSSYRMPWAYAVASQIWSFPIVIILAWAVQRHRLRRQRYTVDPPWSGC